MPRKKIVSIKKDIKPKKTAEIAEHYLEGIGRRKTAKARVRFYPDKKSKIPFGIFVNAKPVDKYFSLLKHQNIVRAPFAVLSLDPAKEKVNVKVQGGGINAQAEAIRLGLSRVLVEIDPNNRPRLKALGYLTRDPRMVERKKPGLRKARRPQQWRKR